MWNNIPLTLENIPHIFENIFNMENKLLLSLSKLQVELY